MIENLQDEFFKRGLEPIEVALFCPTCKKQHCDEGEWANRPHTTHRCVDDCFGAGCGHEWQPFMIASYGVRVI